MSEDIFIAARANDAQAVRRFLEAGADPAALNAHNFTALHCAAMGRALEAAKLLIAAGAPLELAPEGRTPLYLAAEFAHDLPLVDALLEAGANPDVHDKSGNHVVVNAMMPEVKARLSALTGFPVPPPPPPRPKAVKLKAAEWRDERARLAPVFARLRSEGFVVLEDAGTTQSDAFSDCVEVFHDRGGAEAGLWAFCFYTRQDLDRAKRTAQLTLGFWGGPEGEPESMRKAGEALVGALRDAGFTVDWNGSGSMRPTIYLRPEA